MAYSADSFTALEVPTLAKMNKLWSNDASFNDGTGIADNAILTRHLLAANVTAAKLAADVGNFQVLSDVALAANGDTISSGTIPAKRHLRIIMLLAPTGGTITSNIRFNNDSGNNYAFNRTSGDTLNANYVGTGNSTLFQYSVCDVFNNPLIEKPIHMHTNFYSPGAGSAPIYDRTTGKWANTSVQITRVDVFNGGAGDFGIGSRVLVLGRD